MVEAWIPREALIEAAEAFRGGHYQYLVVVGSAREKTPQSLTDADLAAGVLRRRGVVDNRIVVLRVPFHTTNRTYRNAAAFQQWLMKSTLPIRSIDVLTVGIHARKSRILFQYALGNSVRIGIIAAREPSYDPRFWPLSATGIRLVARNVAGYVYAKCWIYLDELRKGGLE